MEKENLYIGDILYSLEGNLSVVKWTVKGAHMNAFADNSELWSYDLEDYNGNKRGMVTYSKGYTDGVTRYFTNREELLKEVVNNTFQNVEPEININSVLYSIGTLGNVTKWVVTEIVTKQNDNSVSKSYRVHTKDCCDTYVSLRDGVLMATNSTNIFYRSKAEAICSTINALMNV